MPVLEQWYFFFFVIGAYLCLSQAMGSSSMSSFGDIQTLKSHPCVAWTPAKLALVFGPEARKNRTSLPRGVISAVDAFRVDPTGQNDSTYGLQRAVTYARTNNVTIFLESGCYRVTDTINATESRNGRWQPVVIVGEENGAASRLYKQNGKSNINDRIASTLRATLFLPEATTGYTDPHSLRTMLWFQTDWCLEPGALIQ